MNVAEARNGVRTLIFVDLFARISYGFARTPVLPLYAAYLGAGPAMIGFVGAAATITGILLKMPLGAISDVVGRKPFLLLGLLVFATGPLGYLLIGSVGGLLAVRFFHGFATTLYSPASMATVASLAGERRGEYLSWLSNSKIAGKLLGAFLGGLVLALATGGTDGSLLEHVRAAFSSDAGFDVARMEDGVFRTAYLVCFAFGATAFVLGLLVMGRIWQPKIEKPRTLSEVGRKFAKGMREMVSNSRILIASGSEGVQNLTVGIVEHFLPVYAVFGAGLTPLEAGYLYAAQLGATIVAKPAFGRWSDRRGRRGIIVAGMALCALPFAAIPWVTGFGTLFTLSIVFGLGEAIVTSSASALVGDLCKERSLGAAMGVFGTIKDSGHALGPILGGLLIGALASGAGSTQVAPEAYRITFGAVALLLLLYAAIFAVTTRPREGPQAGHPD